MRWLLAAVLVLLAGGASAHEISCPSGGSDGQRVAASSGTTETAGEIKGPAFSQQAYWLCCNKGVAACTDKALGAFDAYLVTLEDTGGCSAVDVTIGFRNDTSGTNVSVGTLSLATTSLKIDGPRNRIITATVNAATGCTTGADVRVDALRRQYDGH